MGTTLRSTAITLGTLHKPMFILPDRSTLATTLKPKCPVTSTRPTQPAAIPGLRHTITSMLRLRTNSHMWQSRTMHRIQYSTRRRLRTSSTDSCLGHTATTRTHQTRTSLISRLVTRSEIERLQLQSLTVYRSVQSSLAYRLRGCQQGWTVCRSVATDLICTPWAAEEPYHHLVRGWKPIMARGNPSRPCLWR